MGHEILNADIPSNFFLSLCLTIMLEICPLNERELLIRARGLAGVSLGELAKTYAQPFPKTLLRAKGFVGQLLELAQ